MITCSEIAKRPIDPFERTTTTFSVTSKSSLKFSIFPSFSDKKNERSVIFEVVSSAGFSTEAPHSFKSLAKPERSACLPALTPQPVSKACFFPSSRPPLVSSVSFLRTSQEQELMATTRGKKGMKENCNESILSRGEDTFCHRIEVHRRSG